MRRTLLLLFVFIDLCCVRGVRTTTTQVIEDLTMTSTTNGVSSVSDDDSLLNLTLTSSSTTERIKDDEDNGLSEPYLDDYNCVPGKIENLKTVIEGDVITFNWSEPTSKECQMYQVSVNDEYEDIAENNYTAPYVSTRCTLYEIAQVDIQNKTGAVTTRTVPGIVQNLEVTYGSDTIMVTWDPPIDIECVLGYKVTLDGTILAESIMETEYNFTGLEACTSYSIGVAAVSDTDDGQFTERTDKTGVPANIGAVQNMRLELLDDAIRVNWQPPASQSACITGYGIVMWAQSGPSFDASTTDTTYDFTPLVGCKRYNITLKAMIGTRDGVPTTMVTSISDIVTTPPTLMSVIPSKTSSTINLRLQTQTTNMCEITSIIVNCTAEDNDPYDWIISEAETEQNYSDSSSSRTAAVVVEDISEFTNYTCYAYVVNSGGTSEASEPIKFTTAQEVPSAPLNLTYKNNDDGILVLWDTPWKIPGIFRDYRLIITPGVALHYIPEECNLIAQTFTEQTTDLEFQFVKGMSNLEYNVTLAASTDAGYGEEETIFFITLPSASEAPRNVTYEIWMTEETQEPNNIVLSVSWLAPCNPNGALANFQWDLIGVSLGDDQPHNHSSITYANYPQTNTSYGFNVNIRPFFNYTLTLAAYSGDAEEMRGEEYVEIIITPEGVASEPADLTVENITTNSVTILWEEPSNKNGEILAYQINITTTGPNHHIPCELEYDTDFSYTTNSTTLFCEFDQGLPNFHYKISVAAMTNVGYGNERMIEFDTESSEPEMPREMGYSLNNVLGETYDLQVNVTWLLPCNTNGELISFLWNLVGTSTEDFTTYNDSGKTPANSETTDIYYDVAIDDLRPLHSYSLSIAGIVRAIGEEDIIGEASIITFESVDGLPTAPLNLRVTDKTSDSAILLWDEPENKNGKLEHYRFVVTSDGPMYPIPDGCAVDHRSLIYNVTVDPDVRNYAIQAEPNFHYAVTVTATTRTDYGPESELAFTTLPDAPQTLKNLGEHIVTMETETYSSYVTISFDLPCDLHGLFMHYSINIFGERDGSIIADHEFTIDKHANNSFQLMLKPQYSYHGYIDIYTTSNYSRTPIVNFTAPSGVPPISTTVLAKPILTDTTATLVLNDQLFDIGQGDIVYYAIIINVAAEITEGLGGGFNFWEAPLWPSSGLWSNTGAHIEYQTTPEFWNPFAQTRATNYTYIVGNGNCSSNLRTYCNGPLVPGTQYAVRVRGFTANAYRDTGVVYFVTPSDNYLALILGLVFGILTAILLLIFIFLLWRRKKKDKTDNSEKTISIQVGKPPPIPKNKFVEHCLLFEEDRSQLKAEYSHLDRLSATEKPTSDAAMADNNKKKNRYINIMPYDDTRVKLATDSNDNYEDYINASYIRGYSGNPEYIATQGPMGSTLEDFWKMIIQEDVGIIVMVAQFVEQSKQKCFKYFPEKEEIMNIGNDINVKCTGEANLDEYVTRTLIVEKDGEQKAVNHLQYMLWPDFGCPTNTSSMIEFREIMRKHIEATKNKAVVHCSAGVGRTGTLIAIDILLQKIDNSGDDIDVFGTVLDLRRQRTHMVQTEKQYEYIHKCLRDYFMKPRPISDGNLSPIYENINIINGYSDIIRTNGGHASRENLIKLKEL